MAERIVVWTETAAKQRREILKYWTKRNGSTKYAEKLIRITKNRINTILANPLASKKADYPETREAALGHFSIYYQIIPKADIIQTKDIEEKIVQIKAEIVGIAGSYVENRQRKYGQFLPIDWA